MTSRQIEDLHIAMRSAHQARLDAFNNDDAEGCSKQYEPDGVVRALPFSIFRGRSEIQTFWKRIISVGFGTVECMDPHLVILDEKADRLFGNVNKALWVMQPNGEIFLREEIIEFHGERIDFTNDGTGTLDSSLMLSQEIISASSDRHRQ